MKTSNLIAFFEAAILSLLPVKNPVALKSLGLRIKELRLKNKLSQEKLGLMADVTELTIQRLESAKFGCSIDNLVSIANALDISLKDLFDFEYKEQ